MNVNHEHKIIWWAPERCGTKALAHVFSKLGFEFYNRLSAYEKGVTSEYQSHEVEIPKELLDYKVIFSTRNPYDRILSLFTNFTNVGKKIHYMKDNQSNFINRYEIFLDELFTNDGNRINKPILNNYVLKYSFKDKVPDMIIRVESMIEDLSKIEFVKDSNLWKSGYIHDYLSNNEYKIRRPYVYNKVYTRTSAKIVYEHQTKHFILGGYDPFSFTTETLSNEDKMKFIHDNLQ
jgi:hypothetical protein